MRCSVDVMAASLGLEPRQRDPESLVLPLHYEAKNTQGQDLKPNLANTQEKRAVSLQFNPTLSPRLHARLRLRDSSRF
jgi:hypothetical protein